MFKFKKEKKTQIEVKEPQGGMFYKRGMSDINEHDIVILEGEQYLVGWIEDKRTSKEIIGLFPMGGQQGYVYNRIPDGIEYFKLVHRT